MVASILWFSRERRTVLVTLRDGSVSSEIVTPQRMDSRLRGKDRSRDERMLVGRLPRGGGGPHAVTRVDSRLREEHPSYWTEILGGGMTETVILRDSSVSSPSPSFTVRSCCRDHGDNTSIVVSDAGDSNINADINATHCGQSCI